MSLFKGNPCALPEHLKERLHNDWPWPLSRLPRSLNAKGPMCGVGNPGYVAWPPKLIKGYGVARWETDKADSIIEIPYFKEREIDGSVYGNEVIAIERNPGKPDVGKTKMITLGWIEGMNIPNQYSPSALQKFSKKGYMELSPSYKSKWRKLTEKEEPVLFYRNGWRPDHVDVYYNWGPFAGLKWE